MGLNVIFIERMVYFRSDSGSGFHCGALGGFQRASICYVGHQGNSLPADSTHAPCRSTRWNMASPWIRCLHPQTGQIPINILLEYKKETQMCEI